VLIYDFPFLIFLLCLALEVFKEVRLLLGAIKEAELLIDDSKLAGGADSTSFEHDFLVVVKLELILRITDEIQPEEFPARHLFDVRIPYRRVVVEIERQFAVA